MSAWRAHIVLLGDSAAGGPDAATTARSTRSRRCCARATRRTARSASLSLPEYERNHWARLDTLVAAGADGFEIVNAAPKANELIPGPARLASSRWPGGPNRFVVGVSDSHGWGATSMVWNLVPLPGAGPTARPRAAAMLDGLREGFGAVADRRAPPAPRRQRLAGWLTPVGVVWETWRGMGWPLTLAWLAWIWLPVGRRRRRRYT